jgi:ABC-type Fe3+-hydroxamate transport system substrate-binding protein
MKKLLLAAVATTSLLAACSHSATEFKSFSEKTITDALKKQNVTATVVCDKPPSNNVGTEFNCVATTDAGVKFNVSMKITKSNEVTVQSLTPADGSGGGTTDSTVPSTDAAPTTSAG